MILCINEKIYISSLYTYSYNQKLISNFNNGYCRPNNINIDTHSKSFQVNSTQI